MSSACLPHTDMRHYARDRDSQWARATTFATITRPRPHCCTTRERVVDALLSKHWFWGSGRAHSCAGSSSDGATSPDLHLRCTAPESSVVRLCKSLLLQTHSLCISKRQSCQCRMSKSQIGPLHNRGENAVSCHQTQSLLQT